MSQVTELHMVKLNAKAIQKTAKFLLETESQDLINTLMFQKGAQEISWADLRTKADLTATQLKELKAQHSSPMVAAMHLTEETGITYLDVNEDKMNTIINSALALLGDEFKWNKLVEYLSYLFNTTPEVIEDLTIPEIQELVGKLVNDISFTNALA